MRPVFPQTGRMLGTTHDIRGFQPSSLEGPNHILCCLAAEVDESISSQFFATARSCTAWRRRDNALLYLPESTGVGTDQSPALRKGLGFGGVMTSCQRGVRSEDHSPQTNSSGYPLEVTVNEEIPASSDSRPPPQSLGPKRNREWSSEDEEDHETTSPEDIWVLETLCGLKMKLKRQRDARPPPQSLGPKRNSRECSSEDEEEDETTGPKDIWVLETLRGLKMKLTRRRVSAVRPEHHEAFQRLLEDPVISRFLAWDTKLRVSDKYLLSMVVAYFGRAGLFSWQYQRIHFFLALYLANDMEEDDEAPKRAIFSCLYGNDRSRLPFFHEQRFQFFCSMGCNARVTLEECEEIQAFQPELWVWGRERALIPETRRPERRPRNTGEMLFVSTKTILRIMRKGRRRRSRR